MEDYDGGEVQLEFEEYGKEGDPRSVFHTINIKSDIFYHLKLWNNGSTA